MGQIGVWLVGAQGSLASTVVLGARAVARGLTRPAALVTELPELAALPAGCPFHPRCPEVFDPCRKIDPEGRTAGEQEVRCHLY
jgi:oligopeptide/dipeptide ABC transporter ATP-binding protein